MPTTTVVHRPRERDGSPDRGHLFISCVSPDPVTPIYGRVVCRHRLNQLVVRASWPVTRVHSTRRLRTLPRASSNAAAVASSVAATAGTLRPISVVPTTRRLGIAIRLAEMTTRASNGPDSLGCDWNAVIVVWSMKSGRTSERRPATTSIAPELRNDWIIIGSIIAGGRSTQV